MGSRRVFILAILCSYPLAQSLMNNLKQVRRILNRLTIQPYYINILLLIYSDWTLFPLIKKIIGFVAVNLIKSNKHFYIHISLINHLKDILWGQQVETRYIMPWVSHHSECFSRASLAIGEKTYIKFLHRFINHGPNLLSIDIHITGALVKNRVKAVNVLLFILSKVELCFIFLSNYDTISWTVYDILLTHFDLSIIQRSFSN